jgi:DNA invertase Pin-like site-specific DNA recombinase
MVRAAIYARISYDPDERAVGVERQREDCLRLAASRGWTVVDEYIDNNVSASKYSRKARTQYLRLLDDIEAGRIDAVVIWMEDRLQRQVLELAEFLKVCDGAGVTRIASIGGEFDLSDPEQRTRLYIKAAMAEAEVEKLRRRVLRQRLQAAQNGEPHGGGRRGFGFAGAGKNAITVEQVEQERALIRDLAARVLSGQSLNGVATDWRQREIHTPSGNYWSAQNLRQMLLSPSIAGYRTHHGTLIEGSWEPIIPREQWELLKALLEDPVRLNGKRGRPAGYLLTGLMVCGTCGHRMVVDYSRRSGGRRVRAYKCKHRPAYGGCGRVSRDAETIENLIVEALFVAVESDDFNRLASSHADDPTRELYELLAHDQGLLDRLADKVAEELITVEFAKRKRAEIENRMQETRSKLARLGSARAIAGIPRNLRDEWPNYSMDRKRAILGAVLNKVTVHPQRSPTPFDPDLIDPDWKV